MKKHFNSLGKTIYDTQENSKLDTAVKKLLSHRQILAYILKYAVVDFSGYSLEEIVPMIDKVHVGTIPVEPGSTNDMITGENTEYSETGEGRNVYDIRFYTTIPGETASTEYNVTVDVEAQAKQDVTYDIETRGIVYCSRLISEQMGNIMKGGHYENVQKVYSIWVCMNCPEKDANTITEYAVTEVNRIGNYTGNPHVDLMRLVMIRLPKDDQRDKAASPATQLMDMLSTLLSNRIEPETKIGTLEGQFGIQATEDMRQEVNDMCNYSSAIRDEGYKAGKNEGYESASEATALRMLKAGKYGKEEIADITGLDVSKVEELEKKLNSDTLTV